MMHYNNVVVTLVDDNRKPLREFNSKKATVGRFCDVYLPFDSQYKFLIKNNNDCRVICEIEIDGSCVTGGGLILEAHKTEYIERFVDVDRKFKFVKSTHEAVADPSNPGNGGICVKVHREVAPPPKIVYVREQPIQWPNWPTYGLGDIFCGGGRGMSSGGRYGSSGVVGEVGPSGQVTNCSDAYACSSPLRGMAFDSYVPEEKGGATVEGEKSTQSFGTTHWLGKDPNSLIEFYFSLKPSGQDPEYLEYLKLRTKFEGK